MHFDNYREMWPYRDWVINAFNINLPFDKFTVSQLAGDLLPDPSDDDLIATGFERCNMTTNEGGTIEEENLVSYARDRVETLSWVFLGLTANCSVCHDHKFDPITTRDFYSMTAFFRNTTQGGFDGNVKDSNPSMIVVEDPGERTRWHALPGEIATAKEHIKDVRTNAQPAFDAWLASAKPEDLAHQVIDKGLVFNAKLTEGQGKEIAAACGDSTKSFQAVGDVSWKPDGKLGPALVFSKDATASFPDAGDFDVHQPFSYGAWVYIPTNAVDGTSIFARMDEADDHRGWDLWYDGGTIAAHFVNKWPQNALKIRTKKAVTKKGEWQHVFVTYDGTGEANGAHIYVNGASQEVDVDPRKITGTLRTTTPLKLTQRSTGSHFLGGALQDVRIYSRSLPAGEVKLLGKYPGMKGIADTSIADWKDDTRKDVFEYFLTTKHEPYLKAEATVASLESDKEAIRNRNPVTHIQQEKKDSMAKARILFRGQYDKPKDEVEPAVWKVLHPFPQNAPKNRLGLAQWIVSPENSLTSRVTVNRFWQDVFGTGIVKTAEDFGIMGEAPVNQPLLDWLAVEFRESGWDVKHIFKLMVTSATYRQSAQATPEKIDKDPANRLLSRGPRFRMDAEMVRDYALAASGLLVRKVGGPSVKPYQPADVWEAVAMPESNTHFYKQDKNDALYRRSLYTFWKRAAPPASMDIFNAPSREVSCLRRERTDTPLQALATLNDVQFVEAARSLAESALLKSRGDQAATLDLIARRVLSRPLTRRETDIVLEDLKSLRAHYDSQPAAAKELIHVGDSRPDDSLPPGQLAAWTMTVNQLLNLDEALNK
jgi:hypothetical protein